MNWTSHHNTKGISFFFYHKVVTISIQFHYCKMNLICYTGIACALPDSYIIYMCNIGIDLCRLKCAAAIPNYSSQQNKQLWTKSLSFSLT